jgi:hypothetical protein
MKYLPTLFTVASLSVGAVACGSASNGTSSSSAADKLAVATVVKRYYAALAAGDGVTACSMILSNLARSAPEDYGQAPGPSFLRGGKTCPAIIVLLSKHFHARLADAVEVTSVHVNRHSAVALLHSATLPASVFDLEREGGVWKVGGLLGDVQH